MVCSHFCGQEHTKEDPYILNCWQLVKCFFSKLKSKLDRQFNINLQNSSISGWPLQHYSKDPPESSPLLAKNLFSHSFPRTQAECAHRIDKARLYPLFVAVSLLQIIYNTRQNMTPAERSKLSVLQMVPFCLPSEIKLKRRDREKN